METKEQSRTRIGFSRMEKKYEWKDHVIFMGILLATAVWVNRNIEIKGLYMDDLYFWSCYGEQGFLQGRLGHPKLCGIALTGSVTGQNCQAD